MAILKLSATALAVGSALAAQAAPVLVSETITLGQVLNGGSGNFQFDVGAALASRGLEAGNALSGSLVVYGISDASYNSNSSPVFGAYQTASSSSYVAYYSGGCYYSWWGGGSCYYYPVYATATDMLRSGDVAHRDTVADTMSVHAGGSQGSDVADQLTSSTGAYGGWNYESQVNNGYNYTRYYNRQRDVYEAIQGSLEVDLGLDALALGDLRNDGVLSFDVAATVGQFRLVSATLNLQVDDAPPTGLPEPGTLGLVAAAALTGASFTRRRRKS
jgi:hypothetical protein